MPKSLEIKLFHPVMLQPGTKKNNFATLLATTVHRKTNAGQFKSENWFHKKTPLGKESAQCTCTNRLTSSFMSSLVLAYHQADLFVFVLLSDVYIRIIY